MTRFVTRTGGTKDIVYTKGDVRRIEEDKEQGTLEFKRSLSLEVYFKNPDDKENLKAAKKYNKFYELMIVVKDKKGNPLNFNVDIYYKWMKTYRFFRAKSDSGEAVFSLPSWEYKINVGVKKFLFFTKKESLLINLKGKTKKEIVF
ncbi:hypothetical protein KY360_06690 [Candidatus Woesearchaeota archaeon]|nr:hypothetical protein [Candidatus Woesearchaeota archaeon]